MAIFARRHYEQIAQTLKVCLNSGEWESVESTTEAFITMFKMDNPAFDTGRFRVASGIRLR